MGVMVIINEALLLHYLRMILFKGKRNTVVSLLQLPICRTLWTTQVTMRSGDFSSPIVQLYFWSTIKYNSGDLGADVSAV